jgi:hypothetical protein
LKTTIILTMNKKEIINVDGTEITVITSKENKD